MATMQETHRILLLIGGLLSLVVIPTAITARRRAFLKRADLRYDNVAVMWERIFQFKALLDAALGVLLLISLAVPPDGVVCKGLGMLYQAEELMTLGVIVRMAQHPFYFMLKREDMNETRQYFNHTVGLCLGGALLITVPLAVFSTFGRSYSLCWMTSVPLQFYAFFLPAAACLLTTCIILGRLARVAHHRYASRLPTVYHGDFFRQVARGLELHFVFLAFVGVYPYVFRIASRAHLWRHGAQQPVLAFLEYLTIAFRGPLDALAYMPKDSVQRLYRALRRRWQQRSHQQQQSLGTTAEAIEAGAARAGGDTTNDDEKGVVRLTLLGKARPLPFFTDQPTRTMAEKRVFLSTYNMAECSLASLLLQQPGGGGPGAEKLAEWIPWGADLYVIGVQECMAYEGLGAALLAHVNSNPEGHGEEYVVYSKAIGSTQKALGYHGLIAIWVLARAREVRANCFMLHESKKAAVARGKNLGVVRAENKGGVGMAFRYYDTTFALLNSHLASDLKGRSRLGKRTKDACQLLLETNLWREEYILDVSSQHHVCVFMGDLNFRLKRPTPAAVLEDVAAICQRERDGPCGGKGDWRRRRYWELLRAAAGEGMKARYDPDSDGAAGGGRGMLQQQGPGAAGDEPAPPSSPSDAEDEESDDEDDDDGYGDTEEDAHGQPITSRRRRRRKRPRLPALVSGLAREVRSYIEGPSPHHTAELALRRSLSSYDRQARRQEHKAAAAVGGGNGGGGGGGDGGGPSGGAKAVAAAGKQLRSKLGRSLRRVQASSIRIAGRVRGEDGETLEEDDDVEDVDQDVSEIELGLGASSSQAAASSSSTTAQLRRGQGQVPEGEAEAEGPTARTWAELLAADELTHVMASGEAFYGFQEPEIRFPPSYRRIKGPAGACGDYADAARLKQAYSIQVKEKRLSFAAGRHRMGSTATSANRLAAGTGTSSASGVGGTGALLPPPSHGRASSNSSLPPSGQSAPRLVGVGVTDSSGPGPESQRGLTNLTADSTGIVGGGQGGSSGSGSGSGTGGRPTSANKGGTTTSRVPSYTDRILVHTFPDYAPRVQVGPYELCDALTASDHRPVSTLLRVQVNVGVRGLQTFQHGRRSKANKKAQAEAEANAEAAPETAPPATTTPAAPPSVVAPQRDVVTVHDAAFYLLELSNVSVEFAPAGAAPGTGTPPDDEAAVLCLFPLDNEDCFSILRRPAIVAAVAKNLAWLTSEEERDPFAFLVLHSYASVRQRGLSIVSCNRPEMGGLHASFALCDYRGAQLGSCVIALSDSDGQPVPRIQGGVFPLTVGGSRCGTLRCDVRMTQLWLDGHH